MNVFLGLNASSEDLGLEKFATWSYPDNETVFRFDEYAGLGVEEALEREGGRARFSDDVKRTKSFIKFRLGCCCPS